MITFLSKHLALSKKGAKDLLKGTLFTMLLDIAFMLQSVYIFIFLDDCLKPMIDQTNACGKGLQYYIALSGIFLSVTWIIARLQYRSTFTTIYEESANRRISLAEKLRKLPLAFFGEKNLSDLTSTIMSDNTELEHTFSHAVPPLFASIICIPLIATGLFFYEWRLALALFWVVPIAAFVIILSKKFQRNSHKTVYGCL